MTRSRIDRVPCPAGATPHRFGGSDPCRGAGGTPRREPGGGDPGDGRDQQARRVKGHDVQRKPERVRVLRGEPDAQRVPAGQAKRDRRDPGEETEAQVVTAKRRRGDAVGGERADDRPLGVHETGEHDERAEHTGYQEQDREQVGELPEGLHVLVERHVGRLVGARRRHHIVAAGQVGRGRHELAGVAAVAGVEDELRLRISGELTDKRLGSEHHTELLGAGHHFLLRARRPEVLSRQSAPRDAHG